MQENKMGTLPIPKLLAGMALPMIISMLVQALYNIVDSVFIARVSENALTAVSLVFPWQNLLIAAAVGTGVGVNALLSRALGAKDQARAHAVGQTGIVLALISTVFFSILGLALCPYFFRIQTDVAEIVQAGEAYMNVVSLFSIGVFLICMTEKILAATGKTHLTMYTQLTGAVINIILDPILIFGLFGFPAMGTAGAAIATVIGQIAGGLMGLWLCHHKNPEVSVHLKGFRWDGALVRDIYGTALPSIVMQSIGSVMTFGMNLILISFSTTATAVFGVYFKLQSFVFLPVFAMNNALVPVASFNYGAGNGQRIVSAWKFTLLCACLFMTVGALVFLLFPQVLLSFFKAGDAMLEIGIPALRIIALSFIPASFGVVTSGLFQSLGHSFLSMWVSLVRQLIALLPLAWLFAQSGRLLLVWTAFPLSELISFSLSVLFLVILWKRQLRPLLRQA
jgi:putative MATE family efflux protein